MKDEHERSLRTIKGGVFGGKQPTRFSGKSNLQTIDMPLKHEPSTQKQSLAELDDYPRDGANHEIRPRGTPSEPNIRSNKHSSQKLHQHSSGELQQFPLVVGSAGHDAVLIL